MDAVAEVYASIFGPDPTAYRAERGLLDVHEEMGIMVQEVVGQRSANTFFRLVQESRSEQRISLVGAN